jgi:hypothetical protein
LLVHIGDVSRKALVLSLVGATCVGAAAAGGFVAMRMNTADRALADAGAPNAPATTVASVPVASTTRAPADASSAAPADAPAPAPDATTSAPPAPAVPARAPRTSPRTDHATPTRSVAMTPAPAPSHVVTPDATDATAPPPPPAPAVAAPPPPPPTDPPDGTLDAAAPPIDPQPTFDDVTVKTDSVIGLSLDTPVSSATARVEDRVTAHTTRDVLVDGRVAIPHNSRLEGVVTLVQHGGKFKDQSRIGLKFTTLYLPDNTKFGIQTDPIFRDGEAPSNEAASRVGAGGILGAILGAVVGGKKGAAIGAAAGAGGGAATVAASDANAATIPSGVPMTVRLTAPVTVTVARDQDQ